MRITVKLFSVMRKYQPELAVGESLSLDVPCGTTTGEVKALVGIPPAVTVLAMVSGRVRKPEHVLSDGDAIYLFPPVSGG